MSDDEGESGWEAAYANDDAVGWDTGDPQPVVVALAEAGAFASPVLDVGCGLGTEACYLASEGHRVVGVDRAPTAVERARDRAGARDVAARFETGDAFELGTSAGVLDADAAASVLDVGVLHTLPEPESEHGDLRGKYVDALARVLEPGGRAFVLSFGPDAPADWPPERISRDDVRDAFDLDEPADDFSLVEFRDETYVSRGGEVPALLAVLERRG